MASGKALVMRTAALVTTAAVAGLVAFVVVRPAVADPPVAQAWIDNPLDGSVVTLTPVGVLAHAYDPAGVADVVLLVNGSEAQTVVPDPVGQPLTYVEIPWVPPAAGSFVLTVVGRNGRGERGVPGQAMVIVGARVRPAPTSPPPTTTPTPSPPPSPSAPPPSSPPPSSPPPPSPCTPPAPVLLQPSNGVVFTSTGTYAPTFTWSAWRGAPPTCLPSGFRIEVTHGQSVVGTDTTAAVTTWQAAPALPCGSTYTWRVGSKRNDSTLSSWSASRTFVIACIPA